MEIIKKYNNRKLYSTKTNSYITLTELAQRVKNAKEFMVIDNKTHADITNKCIKAALISSDLSLEEVVEILKR